MFILASGVIILILSLLAVLFFREIPDTNRDLLNIAVGALLTKLSIIISYYFGSSKSSADKNEMINKQLPGE